MKIKSIHKPVPATSQEPPATAIDCDPQPALPTTPAVGTPDPSAAANRRRVKKEANK